MNEQIKMDHNIIESLLFLVNNNTTEPTVLSGQNGQSTSSVLHAPDTRSAFQLMEFADEMPGGFFIYHADGNEELIYANKAMLRIFGCDTMEEFQTLTGNSFRGIVHPDDLMAVEESIKQQIQNSHYDLDYVEYRIIRKDGEIRWVDDYGHFIHSETAGDIFYVFLGDSTEKKEQQLETQFSLLNEKLNNEKFLQEQIKKYEQKAQLIHQEHTKCLEIIEGLSCDYESIFYVDLDTNKIKAYRISKRFQKIFPEDYHTQKFIGFDKEYIQEYVLPEDKHLLLNVSTPEYIRRRLSNTNSFHINYRIFRDGVPSYIQLRIVNTGSTEHISQIILGYRNIDEEMQQEMKQKQMLSKALKEATLANNARKLFLSNMSHDIRTPMNAIVNFTSLIQKHIDNKEKISEYLNLLSVSSEQLLQLLNDVLEISRIESGEIHVEESACSLMELIHQLQKTMLAKAAKKDILFSLDISNLKHDSVYTDAHKLKEILTYLIDNAIKYTNLDGHISITITEREKTSTDLVNYQFVVQDNGIGISEQFLKHIFDPFEREKNTTFSGIHGTGLGLTITKRLIEMLDGTITVESVIGQGSKFIISLPLRVQTDVPKQTQDNNIKKTINQPSAPKRILIVDDNEINLEIEHEVLTDAGFLVETASDGSIAVEKVKQSEPGKYNLILMDIQMPIMNGYNATKAIREIDNPALADIPIIAVSANTFEEDKRKAIESGMNAHMAKPIDTPRLYKLIRKFLNE